MTRLLCVIGETLHDRQGFRDQTVHRRVPVRERIQLQAKRIAIARGRAHHVLPRDQPLEHPVHLAGVAPERFRDLGARESILLLGEQFEDIETFIQRGRAVPVGVGGIVCLHDGLQLSRLKARC